MQFESLNYCRNSIETLYSLRLILQLARVTFVTYISFKHTGSDSEKNSLEHR